MKVHLLLPFLFGILNAFALTDKHAKESMELSSQAPKFLKRSDENCGLKASLVNRIIEGKEAEKYAYPWMGSFRYAGIHLCGGTLIHPRYMLTAGHCFRMFGERNSSLYWEYFPYLQLVFGDHYLNTTEPQEQMFSIANYTFLETEEIRSGVPLDNDVAVVKLNGTAKLNNYVSLICMPIPPIAIVPGDELTIAGWGRAKYETFDVVPEASHVLRETKVKVIKNEDCGNIYEPKDKNGHTIQYGQQVGKDLFCTISKNGQPWNGDSGGPVMYIDPITGKHVQVGILSYCRGRISEVASANVTYFLKEIEEMMTDLDKY